MKLIFTLLLVSVGLIANAGCVSSGQQDTDYLKMLKQLETLLKTEIPGGIFITEDGVPNFYVIDLTDSMNIGKKLPGDDLPFIKFIPGHFYHVAPALKYISYSFIIYIQEDRTLKIFRRVNCNQPGNSLSDVLAFASGKLGNNKNKEAIIGRIKRYRTSVKFFATDNYGTGEPNCK